MKIFELLENINYEILNSDFQKNFSNIEIEEIDFDSRRVNSSMVFFALVRGEIDGHEYIEAAIENGCKIIVVERNVLDTMNEYLDKALFIKVKDANEAISIMATHLNGYPSKSLKLVGVTGTNGKTTTTCLIERCLKKMEKKTGLIGTTAVHILDNEFPAHNTTPFAPELEKIFKDMKDAGVEYGIMEVASHALSLKRVATCEYEVAVYTNLTQDHLDFHKTMENYRDAKLQLFKQAKKAVINIDTPYSEFYVNNVNIPTLTYGIHNDADIKAENVSITISGSEFDVKYKDMTEHVSIATPGDFSVYNALATIGAVLSLGYELSEIVRVLNTLDGICGRFQTFTSKKGFSVVVDYAHTPDGFLNILETANKFVKGNITFLFGCGGDRDTTKRPIMGRIACENADFVVVTSDNPRTEDPHKIFNDIEAGITEYKDKYVLIENRFEATKYAIENAKEGDLVILAGKGHEDYQIIGHTRYHFSDIENVTKLLSIN